MVNRRRTPVGGVILARSAWTEGRSEAAGNARVPPLRSVRTLPGGIAAVMVTALLWTVSGTVGLAGGGILLAAWAVLPATYAFAVGQVVFVAVTRPDGLLDIGLLSLLLVELGLIAVLVGPTLRSTGGWRMAVWILLGGGVLSGVALVSYALWDRVWIAATVLASIVVLAAYGFHRYELVVLGKVPDYTDGQAPGEQGVTTDDGTEHDSATHGPDEARRSPVEEGADQNGASVTSQDERGEAREQ